MTTRVRTSWLCLAAALLAACQTSKGSAQQVALSVDASKVVGRVDEKLVAPGSLDARNNLDRASAVRLAAGEVKVSGETFGFTMPRWSAAVLTLGERASTSARPARGVSP
jgi:predicted small secreted protein